MKSSVCPTVPFVAKMLMRYEKDDLKERLEQRFRVFAIRHRNWRENSRWFVLFISTLLTFLLQGMVIPISPATENGNYTRRNESVEGTQKGAEQNTYRIEVPDGYKATIKLSGSVSKANCAPNAYFSFNGVIHSVGEKKEFVETFTSDAEVIVHASGTALPLSANLQIGTPLGGGYPYWKFKGYNYGAFNCQIRYSISISYDCPVISSGSAVGTVGGIVPSAPSGFQVDTAVYGFRLLWNSVDVASWYSVERKIKGEDSWQVIADKVMDYFYYDKDVDTSDFFGGGKTYCYRVRAHNSYGDGGYSEECQRQYANMDTLLTLKFHPEGGEFILVNDTLVVRKGEEYPELPVPTWEGHDFLNWRTAEGHPIKQGDMVIFNVTDVYAQWDDEEVSVPPKAAPVERVPTTSGGTGQSSPGTVAETKSRVTVRFDPGEFGSLPIGDMARTYDVGEIIENVPIPESNRPEYEFSYWDVKATNPGDLMYRIIPSVTKAPAKGVTATAAWTFRKTSQQNYTSAVKTKTSFISILEGETKTSTVVADIGTPISEMLPSASSFSIASLSDLKGNLFTLDTKISTPSVVSVSYARQTEQVQITFMSTGARPAATTRNYMPGKIYGSVPAAPVKDGYKFLGWRTANGNSVTASSTVPSSASTVYAEWEKENMTTVQLVGGEKTTLATLFAEVAQTQVAIPKQTGNTFNGYYTQENGKGTCIIDAMGRQVGTPTSASTLYASYTSNSKKKYSIKFDYCGGTNPLGILTSSAKGIEVAYGEALPKVSTPKWTMHTFMGYYKGKNGTGTKYYDSNGNPATFSKTWDQNSGATLYAHWKNGYVLASKSSELKNFSSKFAEVSSVLPAEVALNADEQGGNGTHPSFAESEYDCEITLDPVGGTCPVDTLIVKSTSFASALPIPERYGCNFAGWYTSPKGGDKLVQGIRIPQKITVYARWVAEVTFDANGGTGVQERQEYVVDQPYGSMPVPTREGCVFAGWFFNDEWEDVTLSVPAGGISLCAHWVGSNEVDGVSWSYEIKDAGRLAIVDSCPVRDGWEEGKPLVVPSRIADMPVYRISELGFWHRNCKQVIVPQSVREIDASVFLFEPCLQSMTVPASLTVESSSTLTFMDGFSLGEVIYPNGVGRIAPRAFRCCTNLKNVMVGRDVKMIGRLAFFGCPKGIVVKFWGEPPACLRAACLEDAVILYPASMENAWKAALAEAELEGGRPFDDSVAATLSVAFDACGGSVSVSELQYTSGEVFGALPSAARAGHDFVGWKTQSGELVTAETVVTKSMTRLVADWKKTDELAYVTQIVASTDDPSGISLEWRCEPACASYEVYRSEHFAIPQMTSYATVSGCSFFDEKVIAGVDYCYWIKAKNGAESTQSEVVRGMAPFVLNASPTNFTFGADGGDGVVAIRANGGWSATALGAGIELLSKHGSGDGTLSFTVKPGRTILPETGTIRIASDSDPFTCAASVQVTRQTAAGVSGQEALPDLAFTENGGPAVGAVYLAREEESPKAEILFDENEPICLCMKITNRGLADTEGGFRVLHELIDSKTKEVVQSCWTGHDDALAVGAGIEWDMERFPLLQHLVAGSYVYRCTIDDDGRIKESSKANNTASYSFTAMASLSTPTVKLADGTQWTFEWVKSNESVSVVGVWPPPTETLTIPDEIAGFSVVGVSEYAFAGLSISNINLGVSVKEVGAWAFGDIEGLKTVKFDNPETVFDSRAFELQDWFVEETGAKWTLEELKCPTLPDAIGWVAPDTKELFELDMDLFKLPKIEFDEPIRIQLLKEDLWTGKDELSLDATTHEFSCVGGVTNVKVTAMSSWRAYTTARWINLDGPSGEGDGELAYSVLENDSPKSRSATITVWGFGSDMQELVVEQGGKPAPANDAFADAIAVVGKAGEIRGTNDGASTESGEPNLCGTKSVFRSEVSTRSVWYRWTAPADGYVEWRVSGELHPAIGVYTGTDVQSLVACATAFAMKGDSARIRIVVKAGCEYAIGIGSAQDSLDLIGLLELGVSGDSKGPFTLSWEFANEPHLRYVDAASGSDDNDGDGPDSAFASIAAAIEAAEDGDEIIVGDGVYPPIALADTALISIFPETTKSKRLVFRSKNGAARTVIDGGGTNVCFAGRALFSGGRGERSTLVGFTLRNGKGTLSAGGAIYGRLENCILSGNDGGGAQGCELVNCLVVSNSSTFGDAAGASGCILRGCTVCDNAGMGVSRCTNYNSIVQRNVDRRFLFQENVQNYDDASVFFSCCTCPLPAAGFDNFEGDPQLHGDGTWRPAVTSPCYNAGCNDYCESDVDLAGTRRICNGTVDVGAVELETVTLTFDANGGTGTMPPQFVPIDQGASIYSNCFERLGCAFAGWSTEAGGDICYRDGDEILPISDLTLYAVWQAVDLEVSPLSMSFGEDGGTGVISVKVDTPWRAVSDAKWILAKTVRDEGAEGVSLTIRKNNLSLARTGTVTVTSGSVKVNVLISQAAYRGLPTLEVEDGKLVGWRGNQPEVLCLPDGLVEIADYALADCPFVTEVVVPASVQKLGAGIFSGCENLSAVRFRGDRPEYDAQVYAGTGPQLRTYASISAKGWIAISIGDSTWPGAISEWWSGRVTVDFDLNGGMVKDVVILPVLQLESYGTYKLPAWMPIRRGWRFAGWRTARDGGARVTEDDVVRAGLRQTLYASWEPIHYTLRYLPGTGSGTAVRIGLQSGEEHRVRENPFEQKGCAFAGWLDDDGKIHQPGEVVLDLATEEGAAVDFTAVWKPVYSVEFIGTDGSFAVKGSMDPQVILTDETCALARNQFSRQGYEFVGWARSAKGAAEFADGAYVSNLTSEPGGKVALYAQWKACDYTLTVKPNGTKYGSVTIKDGKKTVKSGSEVAAGTKLSLKANPKSGYAFAGWYTDSKCTKKLNPKGYDNREPTIKYTMPAKKTTIYAKFLTKAEDKKALKFTSATKAQTFAAGKTMAALTLKASSASLATLSMKDLPKGMSFDLATGEITGKPTKPGKYTATVTVKSAAGNTISQKVKIYVTVSSGYYGTFDGYALVSKKTPAYVTFTSDKYGAVSGKVTYKGKGYSFKASYSSTSSTKSKFTPKIKIGSIIYKPAVTVEKLADGVTVSEARGEQKGKFVFVAQKKPGLIKSKKALAGLIDQPVKISNKQYADAKLPKSSDKLTLKFAATDKVNVTGKLKGKSVSFSATVIYCRAEVTEAGDVYTAEAALVEPKSGYSRLATFTLTVGAGGKVSKKVSFGKIKAEE